VESHHDHNEVAYWLSRGYVGHVTYSGSVETLIWVRHSLNITGCTMYTWFASQHLTSFHGLNLQLEVSTQEDLK